MDGLGLIGLRLVAIHEPDPLAPAKSDRKRRFEVDPINDPKFCPACGATKFYRHGLRRQTYADVPAHGEPAALLVNRRRWRCNECSAVFPDELPDMDDTRHATKRLVKYVGKRTLEFTFEAVARDVGITGPSVKDMFDDMVSDFQSRYEFVTPTVLGIDELYILGSYRCILTNIQRLTLFDMLPSRKVDVLRQYFPGLSDPENVKYVTSDFYATYAAVTREFFPSATLVIDRFHVQRMGSNAIEAFRKTYRKTLSKPDRIALKNDRHLLLKHATRLDPERRQKVQTIFDEHPEMAWAWAVKELFHDIWEADSREEANRRVEEWLYAVPDWLAPSFKEPISVFRKRRGEILSYFDNRITNGFTESMNGIAKTANRIARGYSFEVIRAKMLYNRKAIERGAVVERWHPPRAEPDEGASIGYMTGFSMRQASTRPLPETKLYYGAHIPTLVLLAEQGML